MNPNTIKLATFMLLLTSMVITLVLAESAGLEITPKAVIILGIVNATIPWVVNHLPGVFATNPAP